MWCNSAKLCSDGLDRNKQNWLKSNCDKDRNHVSGAPEVCDDPSKFSWSDRDYQNPSYTIDDHQRNDQITDNYNSDIGHGEDSDHFKDSKSSKFDLISFPDLNAYLKLYCKLRKYVCTSLLKNYVSARRQVNQFFILILGILAKISGLLLHELSA